MAFSLAERMLLLVNHVRWELKEQLSHLPILILSPAIHEVHAEVMAENLEAVWGEITMQRKQWILRLCHDF